MDDRLQQAHFVSTRYRELHGLFQVLVGGAMVAVSGFVLGAAPSEFVEALAFGAFFLLVIPGSLWVERYYARVFGRVQPSASTQRWTVFGFAAFYGMIFWGELALGVPRIGLAFASWAAYELWIVWRDWPRRLYHLFGAAAAALATMLRLTGPAGEDTTLMAGFFVVGAAMVVTGIGDHRLLASTLYREGDGDESSYELSNEA